MFLSDNFGRHPARRPDEALALTAMKSLRLWLSNRGWRIAFRREVHGAPASGRRRGKSGLVFF